MLTDSQIEEMMARVRLLELKARRLARESFAGEYQSSFRGQGLDFDDYREYQHGDEVRFIDWNVTARMNAPFVRKFREDREISVVLAIDLSASIDYGSIHRSKRETAAEAAAILGFSALANGDKVGLLLFANDTLLFCEPQKGNRHLLRMIREILVTRPQNPGTSFPDAANALLRNLRKKSLIFLMSDFYANDIDRSLAKISGKHDLVALRILDPAESQLPKAGNVILMDPETSAEIHLNTNAPAVQQHYQQLQATYQATVTSYFNRYGIDHAELSTTGDALLDLHRLMKRRARKRNR